MEENLQHVQVPTMNLKEEGLETIDPFIYASIKRFMNNETKIAFPSMTTLVNITGVSKPTLSKSVERLHAAKYITIIREFGKSNKYLFNDYKKFECFSYDFLDMPELSYTEKAYLVVAQPYMFKDSENETGTIHFDQETFADILGLSVPTIRKVERHLKELHILDLKPTSQKELMKVGHNKYIPSTGLSINDRVYSFPAFCNEISFKIQEHDERLDAHEKQIQAIQKKNQELEMKNRELQEKVDKFLKLSNLQFEDVIL